MRALITGASRGIGKATAKVFATHGYEIIAPSRLELDLSSPESINAFVALHADEPLDTLINNAGINDIAEIKDASDETIQRMIETDLLAPIRLLRGFAPALCKSKAGRVVNIGSIWAVVSKPGRGLYSAAKNGIHGVTNAFAMEVASYGVLVNTLCPGFTATELTVQNNSPEQIAEIEKQIPLGRLAEPMEQARAIYWLGSTENTFITAQKIVVDGGFVSR